jgi:hypothetical protein
MSQYSLIDELSQGVACIYRAQELIKEGAPREKVLELLDQAIDAINFFGTEICRQNE